MVDSVAAIQVRPFCDADVVGVVAAFNQARPSGSAPIDADRFWSWFDDPDLSPERDVWVGEADGAILGIVGALPWASHLEEGAIFLLGPSVLPAARKRGLARSLVEEAARACAERHPGTRLITRVALPAAAPMAFLGALGFTEERRHWQLRLPHLEGLPQAQWPEGYEAMPWSSGKDTAPLEGLYAAVLDEPEFMRRRLDPEDVRRWHAMGALPDGALQLIVHQGQWVGLSLWTRWPGAQEAQLHFLGVLPQHRRKGLGAALLLAAIHSAAQAGGSSLRLELAAEVVPEGMLALGFEVQGAEAFMARAL